MRIFVAGLASFRRTFKLNLRLPRRRFVAIAACHRAMCATERKRRFGVVESVHVRPGPRVVAGLAAKHRAVRPSALHASLELALVWINVACGARAVGKMKWKDLVLTACNAHPVAFGARHGHVSTRQWVLCLPVLHNRESRSMKVDHSVTLLAAIFVGLRCKLSVVRVLVAIEASRELHFINRVFARRNVALRAFHFGVHTLQRIFRRFMLGHPEKRRLPVIHRVAFRAFTFLGARGKLAAVWIRFVTVRALLERQRFLEIPADVARDAADRRVLSQERILCLRVIELEG